MSMETISYLFFAALFAATFITGYWLEKSEKAK
jgi:hypothetical protein